MYTCKNIHTNRVSCSEEERAQSAMEGKIARISCQKREKKRETKSNIKENSKPSQSPS